MDLHQKLLSLQSLSQSIADECEKELKKLEPKEKTKKDFAKVFEKRRKMRQRQDYKFQNKI